MGIEALYSSTLVGQVDVENFFEVNFLAIINDESASTADKGRRRFSFAMPPISPRKRMALWLYCKVSLSTRLSDSLHDKGSIPDVHKTRKEESG